MNTVEPIRDMEKLRDMQNYLKSKSERDYMMFMFMLYVPIRISDVLRLRVRDVRDKSHISIREQKTGKEQRFLINEELKKVQKEYLAKKDDYEFLFVSQKGTNQSITRMRAYVIIKETGKMFGVEKLGAHSLRKTFGYMHYQKYHDLVALKELFNHSDVSETRKYIGLNQDIKDKQVKNLSFL